METFPKGTIRKANSLGVVEKQELIQYGSLPLFKLSVLPISESKTLTLFSATELRHKGETTGFLLMLREYEIVTKQERTIYFIRDAILLDKKPLTSYQSASGELKHIVL